MTLSSLEARAGQARLFALAGNREAAVAEYQRVLSEIETGTPMYEEAQLRSELAQLFHEMADPREGEQLTKAAALFQRRGDTVRLVDACLRMARVHQHSAAASLYWADRAMTAAERGANQASLCIALAVRGELLLAFDRVAEAVGALERAVKIPGGERHMPTLASALIRQGRTEEGLDILTKALAEAEGSADDDALERVVHLRIRLADARKALGDSSAALELLTSAAAAAATSRDQDTFVLVSERLGNALLENGNPARAVATLELAIERARAQGRIDAGRMASLYNNLGNALSSIGNDGGAIRSFAEAIDLAKAAGALRSEALANFGLANGAARIGQSRRALDAYDEARALAVRLRDQALEAACLDSLGQLRSRDGEPAKAVDLHKRAAQLHGAIGDYGGQHIDLLNLVQSFLLLHETPSARRALEDARGIGAAHLHRLPWQHGVAEGQVLAREGDWPAARASFNAAIRQLEAERATLATPNDKRRWAAQRVEGFELAARAAFEARDALAALTYLEGNRARFLDAVAERRRRFPAGVSGVTQRAYEIATDRLAELRWQRRQRPTEVNPGLDAELGEATRIWQDLDAEVERFRLDEDDDREPSRDPEQLAQTLSGREVAVALHLTNDWLGVACIGRATDGRLWWDCDVDAGLTLADVSRAVVGMAEGDLTPAGPSWHELTSVTLEEAEDLVVRTCDTVCKSVWPVAERLVQDRADAIVLMPGRGLNVLPLHAAVTGDGRFALDRWSVRYAPSLTVVARAGVVGALPPAKVLGQVVNPTGDLPFANAEAAATRRSWRGEARAPLRGPQAEPDRVLELLRETDVLHFAGHGAFDPDDPLQSRLFCAPSAAGGIITLQTVLERAPSVRTRVVLLCGCETGRVVAGDLLNDHLGLPGGLLIAGASAVLATFWQVDDLAACLILSRCVELWEEGTTDLERALAEAQRWIRTEATVRTVREWIEDRLDDVSEANPELEIAHGRLVVRDDNELLFGNALYWAPFHVTGRAVRTGG
ncbi:MAG TPA: CHAT domain-containing tetratricopeptide repeat protein [Gemmatimonadaceae bacterium]|nr:CHAT domain-containing tetratricopeptide repeat protein [Gemmatimonadaceae bacterium]